MSAVLFHPLVAVMKALPVPWTATDEEQLPPHTAHAQLPSSTQSANQRQQARETGSGNQEDKWSSW